MAMTGCGADSKAYDYDLDEYVKVGSYIGVEYTAIDVEVSEAEIEAEIETILQKYSDQTDLTEGTVKMGDYVDLNYTLTVEGKEVETDQAKDYTVQVGEGQVLAEIDQALVGKKTGETFTVEATFPVDYDINEEMAGKDAVFQITINRVYDLQVPTLNDTFVEENLGFDTVEDYREEVEKTLYEDKLETAEYNAEKEIWDQVMESSQVIQFPEKEIDEKQKAFTENFKALCQQYGMTLETALKTVLDTDEKTFHAGVKENAEEMVKEEMILYAIARENGLEPTKEDQQQYLKEVLAENGLTAREFKAQYSISIEEYAEESGIMLSLLYEKVFDFLLENGIAK